MKTEEEIRKMLELYKTDDKYLQINDDKDNAIALVQLTKQRTFIEALEWVLYGD